MAPKSTPSEPVNVPDIPSTSTNGSGSDSHDLIPDTDPSSESEASETSAQPEANIAHVAVKQGTVDIGGALLSLSACITAEDALPIIKSLDVLRKSPASCQELFDDQGVGIILSNLVRFKDSEQFVKEALHRLTSIAAHLKSNAVGEALLRLKFLDTLVSLAETHRDSRYVQERVVKILNNLVVRADPPSKVKFGTEEIVQVVLNTMTSETDDLLGLYIIRYACGYCVQMSKIPEVKERLIEKGALQLLGAAFQRCRQGKDDDVSVKQKDSMARIVDRSKVAITELMS